MIAVQSPTKSPTPEQIAKYNQKICYILDITNLNLINLKLMVKV